jgi:predicted PurR-regulated permease PerM
MHHDLLDRHRSLRVLIGLVIVVIGIYLINVIWNVLATFGDVILLFFLAWIVTFILDPLSTMLVKRGFSRVLAVSLVYLALLVVVSGLIVLAVPAIQAQVTHLAGQIQSELSSPNLGRLSDSIIRTLERLGFSSKDAHSIVAQMITQIPQKTQQATNQAIGSASTLLPTIGTFLFDASLVMIISFYMMLDGGRLVESLCAKLPRSWEPDVRLFQGYVNDIFGGFFRAQVTVAGLYALLTWVTTWIVLTIPSGGGAGTAFLAAFLAGLFMLLPFIGAFLAVVPPALLVVIQTPPDTIIFKLILLIFLLGAWQHVVLNLIAPKVYGHHLGIDPIVLFAALLLGAKVGGVWGAFFAAPIVAIGYAIFETFYDRFTSTHPAFLVQERLEEEIARYEPFEQTAREVRPHIVPVRTLDASGRTLTPPRDERPDSSEQPAKAANGTNGLHQAGEPHMLAPRGNPRATDRSVSIVDSHSDEAGVNGLGTETVSSHSQAYAVGMSDAIEHENATCQSTDAEGTVSDQVGTAQREERRHANGTSTRRPSSRRRRKH